MFRDPLYRHIRRRLRELRNDNGFELCTNDLLRKIYPSLAPREGGDDAGLDGLIASEDASAIQLICTTGEDVLENLTRSIESNIKKGGNCHACIFATSRQLKNSKKRSLEGRAKELKRPLIQIYDQAGMAQLLYSNTRWLKELLGLTGDPPPLSVFPLTSRPLFDLPPVGREEDIRTIIASKDDMVLIGQPGSGKTHLLFTAAKKAKGRFVIHEDIGRVADGVRSVQPNFLIVDDAHSRLEFLKHLKHFRQEVGADFKILASCWPGQEDAVCTALQTVKCHKLEGLPQNQIKEVIHSQKIYGPEQLLHEIIHQAQGKPGLAVTLCWLCWKTGNTRDVALGTALARDVRHSFEPLLGKDATDMLACFSIGGSAGMTVESVARLLNKNALEIKRAVEQLAAAGVLDISNDRISVHPWRLRQALVRDVFLKGPGMDLSPYLEEAPDFAATTCVLIEGKLLGGTLSDELLRARLEQLRGTHEQAPFEEYAYIGRSETEWVLDTFPERLNGVAKVALEISPAKALDMLLRKASVVQDEASVLVRKEKILPEIQRWILSSKVNDEAFKRRELLAKSLAKFDLTDENKSVAIVAAELVMSIRHESTSSAPGEPMKMVFSRGVVAQDQLQRIASLWPKVLPILREADPSQYGEITNMFHEWIHPSFHGRANEEYERESRSLAKRTMVDLLGAFSGNWTMHHHLHNYAMKLDLEGEVKIDPIAEIVYPARDLSDWESEQRRRQTGVEALASQLADKEPTKVADILTSIEEQARLAHLSYPSLGRDVCWRIAEAAKNPSAWLKAFFERGAPPFLIEGFLVKTIAHDFSEAEEWITLALENRTLQGLGTQLVLKHSNPSTPVWKKASPLFKDFTGMIEGCVLRNEIPSENLKSLLNHEDLGVRGIVAANMWGIRDRPEIPEELFTYWRRAIIENVDEGEEHILEKIFPKYPDIAYDWIAWRLQGIADDTRHFWFGGRYDRAVPAAISALSREQKRDLIDKLPRSSSVAELARSLVDCDYELFMRLLSREELAGVRLDPLRLDFGDSLHTENKVYDFNDGWQRMATAAMERGFSEEDIFSATQRGDFSWSGPLSSVHAARLAPFEKLMQHPDSRLQRVGRIGVTHFRALRDQSLAYEKRAAIRGELA